MLLFTALNIIMTILMKFITLWDLKSYIWSTRNVSFNMVLQYLSYLILKTNKFYCHVKNTSKKRSVHIFSKVPFYISHTSVTSKTKFQTKGNRSFIYKQWNIKFFNVFQNNFCIFHYITILIWKMSFVTHKLKATRCAVTSRNVII